MNAEIEPDESAIQTGRYKPRQRELFEVVTLHEHKILEISYV